MALFLSVAFAAGGTMLGEVWFWFMEGYRIGSHMSYRAGRFFWVRYRPELFAGAMIVFWLLQLKRHAIYGRTARLRHNRRNQPFTA